MLYNLQASDFVCMVSCLFGLQAYASVLSVLRSQRDSIVYLFIMLIYCGHYCLQKYYTVFQKKVHP